MIYLIVLSILGMGFSAWYDFADYYFTENALFF